MSIQILELPDKKQDRIQMTLRLDPQLHEKVVVRMAPLRLKFQLLVEALLERWLTGEFDRRNVDRPITKAETEEDRRILQIVHQPRDRAEKLVSETVKHYMELLEEDKAKEGLPEA